MSVEEPALEHEVWIAARPETVFSFFTDPEKLVRWKGRQAMLAPEPGGIYRVDFDGHDVARGTFIEVVPHQRIVFSWGWEAEGSPLPPGASRVEVTFSPERGGTRVRLRHSGLPDEQARHSHAEGWEHFLPRLVRVAEGREPGPDEPA